VDKTAVIHFAWPYLFILLPLPWLIRRWMPPAEQTNSVKLLVPEIQDFYFSQKNSGKRPNLTKQFFLFSIWFLLVMAASRPQWVGDFVHLPQEGRDIMLAVDLSGSMQAQDFEKDKRVVDRLSAVKWIASDFIEKRKGDRIGLILFGTKAYLQTPLTFDLATVKQLLMESQVGLAGRDTALGDAIGLAVKQLKKSPAKGKVLILLTDGINNAGELTPQKAAEIASREGLKIHTVAIGSNPQHKSVPYLFNGPEIDEEALKFIAEKTSGRYFRAYNTKDLAKIYQEIDTIEKHAKDGKSYRPTRELYFWPLVLAIFGITGIGLMILFERRP